MYSGGNVPTFQRHLLHENRKPLTLVECLNNLLMQISHLCFKKYVQNLAGGQFRASVHERLEPRRFFLQLR